MDFKKMQYTFTILSQINEYIQRNESCRFLIKLSAIEKQHKFYLGWNGDAHVLKTHF